MYIYRNRLSKQTRLKGLLFISFRNDISPAYLIVQDMLLRLPAASDLLINHIARFLNIETMRRDVGRDD